MNWFLFLSSNLREWSGFCLQIFANEAVSTFKSSRMKRFLSSNLREWIGFSTESRGGNAVLVPFAKASKWENTSNPWSKKKKKEKVFRVYLKGVWEKTSNSKYKLKKREKSIKVGTRIIASVVKRDPNPKRFKGTLLFGHNTTSEFLGVFERMLAWQWSVIKNKTKNPLKQQHYYTSLSCQYDDKWKCTYPIFVVVCSMPEVFGSIHDQNQK